MFLLFTAVALQAAVRLPKTSAVDGRYGTVCHDGSAGYGDVEANCIARAVERQLLLCDVHRGRSHVSVAAELVMPASGCASRCGHERLSLSAGRPRLLLGA